MHVFLILTYICVTILCKLIGQGAANDPATQIHPYSARGVRLVCFPFWMCDHYVYALVSFLDLFASLLVYGN